MGRIGQLRLFNQTPYEWHLTSINGLNMPKWCDEVFPLNIYPHSYSENQLEGIPIIFSCGGSHCEGYVTYTLKKPYDEVKEQHKAQRLSQRHSMTEHVVSLNSMQNEDFNTETDEDIIELSFTIIVIGNKIDRYWIHIDWSNLDLIDRCFSQSILSNSHPLSPQDLVSIHYNSQTNSHKKNQSPSKDLIFMQDFTHMPHRAKLTTNGSPVTFPSSPLPISPFIQQLSTPLKNNSTGDMQSEDTRTDNAHPRKSLHPKSILSQITLSPNVFSTRLSKSKPQIIPIGLTYVSRNMVSPPSTAPSTPLLSTSLQSIILPSATFIPTPSPYLAVSNWMEYYYPLLQNTPLNELCSLGSHDASMYKTTKWSKFGLENYTCTQDLSIYQQLLAGSRFFDIRPTAIKKSSSEYKKSMKQYQKDLQIYETALAQQQDDLDEDDSDNDENDENAISSAQNDSQNRQKGQSNQKAHLQHSIISQPLIRPTKPHQYDYYSGHFANQSTYGATGASIQTIIDEINEFTIFHHELITLSISHDKSLSSSKDAHGQRRFNSQQWEELYDLLRGLDYQFLPQLDEIQIYQYTPPSVPDTTCSQISPSLASTNKINNKSTSLQNLALQTSSTSAVSPTSVKPSPKSPKLSKSPKFQTSSSQTSTSYTESGIPLVPLEHLTKLEVNRDNIDFTQLPLSFFLQKQGWNTTHKSSQNIIVNQQSQDNDNPIIHISDALSSTFPPSPSHKSFKFQQQPQQLTLQPCVIILFKLEPQNPHQPPAPLMTSLYSRTCLKVYNHFSNTQTTAKIGPDQFNKILQIQRNPFVAYNDHKPPLVSLSWTHTPKVSKIIRGLFRTFDLRKDSRIFNEQLYNVLPFTYHANSTHELKNIDIVYPTRGKYSKQQWKVVLKEMKLKQDEKNKIEKEHGNAANIMNNDEMNKNMNIYDFDPLSDELTDIEDSGTDFDSDYEDEKAKLSKIDEDDQATHPTTTSNSNSTAEHNNTINTKNIFTQDEINDIAIKFNKNDVFPNKIYLDTVHSHYMWYVMYINLYRFVRTYYHANPSHTRCLQYYIEKSSIPSQQPSTIITTTTSGDQIVQTQINADGSLLTSTTNVTTTTTTTTTISINESSELPLSSITAEINAVIDEIDVVIDENNTLAALSEDERIHLSDLGQNDYPNDDEKTDIVQNLNENDDGYLEFDIGDTKQIWYVDEKKKELKKMEKYKKQKEKEEMKKQKRAEKDKKAARKANEKAAKKRGTSLPATTPLSSSNSTSSNQINAANVQRSDQEQEEFDFCSITRNARPLSINVSKSYLLLDSDDWEEDDLNDEGEQHDQLDQNSTAMADSA